MRIYLFYKNILDILFALILLVLTAPIMVLSAIAIKCESKGPALFKQLRPGKNARIFHVYKFRTMRVETEKEERLLSDKERITKVGAFLRKTSIDELPQLLNILQGKMSFIGPRPLLVQYLELYSAEQMRRHEVAPGISGWAQVNGRNEIGWEEKFKLDVWYVDHISFLVDLKILWMTFVNVIRRTGINNSSVDTMPFFRGSAESKETQHY